jgi:peptidoglycan/LPS O-acetylase OafA/YrhL
MSRQAGQLDALTGLRFIAALLVFTHHIGNKFGLPHFRGCLGAAAVSFFFVLSGFILTYVYHGRLNRGNVRRFYFTRWARIWPLHFVSLLLVLLVAGRWSLINFGEHPFKLLLNGALLQSWIPSGDYIFSFNGVSWSISTELFFYAAFPLFLLGGHRKFWFKYIGLLLFTVAALYCLQGLSDGSSWASKMEFVRIVQANPLLRLPEFCTGMAVGFVFLNRRVDVRRSSWWMDSVVESIALSLLVAYPIAFVVFHPDVIVTRAGWGGAVPGYWVRFGGGALLFAAAIYVFATRRGIWSNLLSSRTMVFLGEISFAFYMTHMIVIQMMNRYEWIASPIPGWALALCCLTIALCVASLLYKMIELPAKAALLEIHDGAGWKSLLGVPESATRFIRQPAGIAIVTTMICAIGFLNQVYQPVVYSPEVQNILEVADSNCRNVDFGKIVRLIGFSMEENPDGIQLNLAWQKLGDVDRPRCVQVCDANGKPILRLHHGVEALSAAKRGEIVVDKVQLNRQQLINGAEIGVGFYSKERGVAAVRTRPRTASNWRYTLLSKRGSSFLE